MERKKLDLTEQRFGYLTVISEAERNKHGKTTYNCKCDCGNEIIINANNLRTENTKSCGCHKREKTTKHGQNTREDPNPIYQSWCDMKQRCYNPNHSRYKDYGGRGIKVYRKWWKFENFYKDMKNTYEKGLSIERINNDGDYKPSNCKWTTPLKQQQNRRCKGYCWNKNKQKWAASIVVNYKQINLGLFNNEENARQAYLNAKEKYHNISLNKNRRS